MPSKLRILRTNGVFSEDLYGVRCEKTAKGEMGRAKSEGGGGRLFLQNAQKSQANLLRIQVPLADVLPMGLLRPHPLEKEILLFVGAIAFFLLLRPIVFGVSSYLHARYCTIILKVSSVTVKRPDHSALPAILGA